MSTSISKKIVINANGKDIVLDGLDFTADGYLEVYEAASVTIVNCRVYNLNTPNSRNYWLKINGDIPVLVDIENCFFGANQSKMYNLFEMTATLIDGSSISNNYFEAGCCSHNTVCIYGAEQRAKIHVNQNVFEESAGTVRIGVKGEPYCSIEMYGNKVIANKADENKQWYGLCCVQPYNTKTVTFANMTIDMADNELPCEQVIYGYSGSKDTRLDEDTAPTVMVNGSAITLPIYH